MSEVGGSYEVGGGKQPYVMNWPWKCCIILFRYTRNKSHNKMVHNFFFVKVCLSYRSKHRRVSSWNYLGNKAISVTRPAVIKCTEGIKLMFRFETMLLPFHPSCGPTLNTEMRTATFQSIVWFTMESVLARNKIFTKMNNIFTVTLQVQKGTPQALSNVICSNLPKTAKIYQLQNVLVRRKGPLSSSLVL